MTYPLSTSQVGNTKVRISHLIKTMAGLIAGGDPRDTTLVEQLAKQYILKDSCIILLTIACESPLVVTSTCIDS